MNKLRQFIAFTILIATIFIINNPKGASAEIVVVHADQAWQLTDRILKKNHIINWKVREDDYNLRVLPQ